MLFDLLPSNFLSDTIYSIAALFYAYRYIDSKKSKEQEVMMITLKEY